MSDVGRFYPRKHQHRIPIFLKKFENGAHGAHGAQGAHSKNFENEEFKENDRENSFPDTSNDLVECAYELDIAVLAQIMADKIENGEVEGGGLGGIQVRQGTL